MLIKIMISRLSQEKLTCWHCQLDWELRLTRLLRQLIMLSFGIIFLRILRDSTIERPKIRLVFTLSHLHPSSTTMKREFS